MTARAGISAAFAVARIGSSSLSGMLSHVSLGLDILAANPYMLPCVVAALFFTVTLFFTVMYLPETASASMKARNRKRGFMGMVEGVRIMAAVGSRTHCTRSTPHAHLVLCACVSASVRRCTHAACTGPAYAPAHDSALVQSVLQLGWGPVPLLCCAVECLCGTLCITRRCRSVAGMILMYVLIGTLPVKDHGLGTRPPSRSVLVFMCLFTQDSIHSAWACSTVCSASSHWHTRCDSRSRRDERVPYMSICSLSLPARHQQMIQFQKDVKSLALRGTFRQGNVMATVGMFLLPWSGGARSARCRAFA